MAAFSNRERCEMYECFILCGRNDERAAEMYSNKYPERRQPNRCLFRRLRNNLMNYGTFVKTKRDRHFDENKENMVLQAVVEQPRNSLREIERTTGIPRSTASVILKRFNYHPYHERPCQGLQHGDQLRRVDFSQWFIRKCDEIPNFCMKVLWSDESRFTNCGMFNRRNTVFWADENPFLAREVRHQIKWGFNVWIGIIGGHIVGPVFYNDNLNAARYLDMLQTDVAECIMELPLGTVQNMFFQQDGAPPHNAQIVSDFLNNEYGGSWIGNRGPILWPARSPDLTPLDFFVWGFLKDRVYSKSYENQDALRGAVEEAVNQITQQKIRESCEAVLERCRLCIRENGGLFEQFL